ncbi:MAG TPA: aldo/keto reductase [Acidimicrobiales bacterium]|nr:aldo/keto reductase [Acidimicrobiales bacterium]
METRRLGSFEVSLVGLGCNNFGMRIDEDQSRDVVHAALDAGINLFDTSDSYGGTRSEQFLGRALAERRDEVIIATKFASPVDDDPSHRGASARWIVEEVENSLRRLGTDRIDLYQQHYPDKDVPLEETLEALDGLVRAGKVLEIGNSNFDADQLRQADGISAKQGRARFVSAQNELSLLRRRAADDLLPACAELGLAFLPYFPLGSGLLTGKYRRGEAPPEGTRMQAWGSGFSERQLTDKNFDRVDALTAWAEARGHSILDLAFAWLLAHDPVATVIAGATRPEQVKANVEAARWKLSAADLVDIGRLLAELG